MIEEANPRVVVGNNGGPGIDDDKASSGWVKIYRDIREHPVVGFGQPVKPNDPSRGAYSRGEAFQDLLMEAQYKPGTTRINGEAVTLEIGQLVAARSYLAFRWNWSEQTVRTFLTHLVKAGIIIINQLSVQRPGTSKKSAANAITLCNYEKYQAYSEAVTAYVASLKAPEVQPAKSEVDQPASNQLTTSQQPAGHQLATGSPPASNQNLRTKESKNLEKEDTREREIVARKDQWGRPIEGPDADVLFDGTRLELVNGLRAEWLERFSGDEQRLDLALKQAAGYVQRNSSKPLAAQVGSQLARIVAEKQDRDQRYVKAAAAKPSPAKPSQPKLSRW